MAEHNLCDGIVEFLNYNGCKVWRTNAGMLPMSYTYKRGYRKGLTVNRMIKVGKKGISDIIGISKTGKFIAIEVKIPSRADKATDAQKEFIADIKFHHGIGGVATSPEEALSIINGENV